MRCPNCHKIAVEDAIFCNHCGKVMTLTCGMCQTVNPGDSRFCHSCGYDLSKEPPTPEPDPEPDEQLQPPEIVVCPRCRIANDAESVYCDACGEPLTVTWKSAWEEDWVDRLTAWVRRIFGRSSNAHDDQIYVPTGFWRRALARIIDIAILLGIILAISIAMEPVGPGQTHLNSVQYFA